MVSRMPAQEKIYIARYIDSLKTLSFPSKIAKTIMLEDAKIQKPWIGTLFRGTKIVKLMCQLRLEFNIDFIHQEVSFCMFKDAF